MTGPKPSLVPCVSPPRRGPGCPRPAAATCPQLGRGHRGWQGHPHPWGSSMCCVSPECQGCRNGTGGHARPRDTRVPVTGGQRGSRPPWLQRVPVGTCTASTLPSTGGTGSDGTLARAVLAHGARWVRLPAGGGGTSAGGALPGPRAPIAGPGSGTWPEQTGELCKQASTGSGRLPNPRRDRDAQGGGCPHPRHGGAATLPTLPRAKSPPRPRVGTDPVPAAGRRGRKPSGQGSGWHR